MLMPPVYNLGANEMNNRNGVGPQPSGLRIVDKNYFYNSVTIKEMDTRGKQYGRGSRANGLLLKKGGNEIPYI